MRENEKERDKEEDREWIRKYWGVIELIFPDVTRYIQYLISR